MVVIAKVESFCHSHEYYFVSVDNNGKWHCSCLDHFFRRRACKHIQAVRTLRYVAVGEMVQKRVKLAKKHIHILEKWRQAHDMPLVRPPDYTPPSKEKALEAAS